MRCGWGFYFRGAFETQAGNSPLQGQSKPPAKLVVLIRIRLFAAHAVSCASALSPRRRLPHEASPRLPVRCRDRNRNRDLNVAELTARKAK